MNNKRRRLMFQAGGQYHLFLDTKYSGYMQPHTHSFYQCVFVKQGHITQMLNGMKYHQIQGDMFFTPPECEHSLFVFGNDTIYYCLSFSRALGEKALALYPDILPDLSNIPPLYSLSGKAYKMLSNIFDALIVEPESVIPNINNEGYHLACAAVMTALSDAAVIKARPTDGYDEENTMNEAVSFMEQYYFQDLTLEEIAERFHFTKYNFYRKFIKKVGVSPKQFITEKRLQEALRLIHHTDYSLNKIAEQVGYNDFSTFYRNFYRMTGKNPSDYRAETINVLQ